jgi:hypothetical protein
LEIVALTKPDPKVIKIRKSFLAPNLLLLQQLRQKNLWRSRINRYDFLSEMAKLTVTESAKTTAKTRSNSLQLCHHRFLQRK